MESLKNGLQAHSGATPLFSMRTAAGWGAEKHEIYAATFGDHPFMTYFYRPQRSCEGYVFTGVCLSTGGCLPRCMLGYHQPPKSRHPPKKQTPQRSRHPPRSRHPSQEADTPQEADTLPRSRHPSQEADTLQEADIPPRADTPKRQTPPHQEQTPTRSRPPPRSRHPARADTPPRSRHPLPEIRPLLRTVRILLECILVTETGRGVAPSLSLSVNRPLFCHI